MNKNSFSTDEHQVNYIEIARHHSQQEKIDALLQKRMQSFIKARRAALCRKGR